MEPRRTTELAAKLRDGAKLHDPMARLAIQLIAATVEELRVRLVDTVGEDMLRMQGAARQFTRLHHELTTTPPNINPEQ